MAMLIYLEHFYIFKLIQKTIVVFTFSTFAGVLVGTVSTLSSILAGCAGTLVDVHLTQTPRKPCICMEENTGLKFVSIIV